MSNDEYDSLTSKKENRGGARSGAGRKPISDEPKVPKKFRFRSSTNSHLLDLCSESGNTQADVVEYAIQRLRKLPKKLKFF